MEAESNQDCICKHPMFCFSPSNEELCVDYLRNKVEGGQLPCNHIISEEFNLYSDVLKPWQIFQEDDPHWIKSYDECSKKNNKVKMVIYAFTNLIKDGSRAKRRSGGGGCTWTGQNKKPVRGSNGQIVGFNRYLTFTREDKRNKSVGKEGHWTMHEYSLPCENNYVLCKITKEVTKSARADSNVRLRYSMVIRGLEEVGRADQDQHRVVDSKNSLQDSGKRKSSEFSVCVPDRYFMSKELDSVVPSVFVSGTTSTCTRFMGRSVWAAEDLQPPLKRTKVEQQLPCVTPVLESSVQPRSGVSCPRTPENLETPSCRQGFWDTSEVRKEMDEVNVSESCCPTSTAQEEDAQHYMSSIRHKESKVEVSATADSYIQVDDIINISDDEGHLGDGDHDDQPLDEMGEDWETNGWNDELSTYLAGDDDMVMSPAIAAVNDIVTVSDDEGHLGDGDYYDQLFDEIGEDWGTDSWANELSTYLASDDAMVRSTDIAVANDLVISDDEGQLRDGDQLLDEIGEDCENDGLMGELYTHSAGDDDQQDATAGQENIMSEKRDKGVSLTEWFTPDQVREHITSLRQCVGKSKINAEKNRGLEHLVSDDFCHLCEAGKINFWPKPIYCTLCGASIKRNAMYYTIGAGLSAQYFCVLCHNGASGEKINIDGVPIQKAELDKKKNDIEVEEEWVECDKCKTWVHQICALFNSQRNEGGEAEFTCPSCYITEVQSGERTPLPQTTVVGANALPRTFLSDHLQQRLIKKLIQERLDRARMQGKSYEEVPAAEGLVIRVVSSVHKKLEVKMRFREIFQEENYPAEFGYKSKVILLFQKIEGVDVCLFAMYVHEFGADCQEPNHRRVYLSYLDSVKYFRPEITAATGEALRTFVYHEILIGYLEYCKTRGFTSCYIWACPPLKGDDFILYCHPESQKTPKCNKLREWYSSMLKKAAEEKIVVELTNLYDHFFVSHGASECKAKVTAARLPYFDGDYLPTAAEDIIHRLQQEEFGGDIHKKGTTKKTTPKRALTASGQACLSGDASKDVLLMHKLRKKIYRGKENFIMVHLQHSCSHCCTLMTSGSCWVCSQCTNFKLCDKCHEAEQKLEKRYRHPINNPKDPHMLYRVEVSGVPADTEDKDETLESVIFDTRLAFLGLCEENHYQFDTLRRAKHSSMMILYHLHNRPAPPVPC